MKKVMVLISAFVVSMVANAIVIPNVLFVELTSNNGHSNQVKLYEASDAIDTEFQNGKDVTKTDIPSGDQADEEMVYIYMINKYTNSTNVNWSSLYVTDLNGRFITVQANKSETSYKLTFPTIYPNTLDLQVVDLETNIKTPVTSATGYAFTAVAGKKYEKRFMLFRPSTPDPGKLEVCHVGDNLEIKNNPFATNIVVKDSEGEVVINMIPLATPQLISLSDLPKGRYTVEFNDGAEKFVISVKPDVTPAN